MTCCDFDDDMLNMFTHFCLGSVDTRSKQVDTSPRFQKTQLPEWDSRSTLDQSSDYVVDTSSGQVDTRPSFQQTIFAEMGQQVDTSSGQVDTLRLKVKIVNFPVHVAPWDLGDLT
ncbi:hypothetical protein Taro_000137 [Colocasia esculenta]|uniref:Uncharacterized protein n=1 Tax=Colocasia esculenta TaxID=4460 RepID=A0A843TGP6_COLES|nr:hypothetical protein [Colocasia esculenta]